MPSFSWGGGSWGSGSWGGSPGDLVEGPGLAIAGTTGNAATIGRDLVTGRLALPLAVIRGPAAIAQAHWEALNLFAGDYFADTRIGLPFYQLIAGRNAPMSMVTNIYRKAILLVPGTVSILDIQSRLNKKTRVLATDYTAQLDDGTILTAVASPYIVFGAIDGKAYA